jgi:DNA-binding NarL/FixJ family response regulator
MNLEAKSKRPRILLADDHVLVAEACKNLLQPEFEVVGIVPDGRQLLQANEDLKPNVIVTDIAMPLLNGLDACEQIKQMTPDVRIIFLTMNTDPELAAEAFRRGASGYVLKSCATSELLVAIREALSGRHHISSRITRGSISNLLLRHEARAESAKLTGRQREVLQLIAEGYLMKEVASMLKLTKRTVAYHKYRTMTILHLKTNSELVQYAMRNFMIPLLPKEQDYPVPLGNYKEV